MSTRSGGEAPKPRASGASPLSRDPAEAVAAVAAAKREVLLRVHRHRLRREDLEDCYGQASLELVVLARKGRAFASLYRAGIRPIEEILERNPLAQDYVKWGLPGPGRWVTIYATAGPTPHVFAVIAGLRIDTSHAGTDVGPNRDQNGPRWRVFDAIPGWAHWSVRHPSGL